MRNLRQKCSLIIIFYPHENERDDSEVSLCQLSKLGISF